MKRIKTTATLVLMAAAMATVGSCSNDVEPATSVADLTDTPIRVTARVNDRASKRAGFKEGDEPVAINLRIRQANESYCWSNVKLRKADDGRWTPVNMPDGKQLLWCGNTSDAEVRAVGFGDDDFSPGLAYNYDAFDSRGYYFQVTGQSTPDSVKSAEVLYCYKEHAGPGTDGTLNLDFDHALSKLVVRYAYGTELDGQDRQLISCTIGEVARCKFCEFDGAQLTFTDVPPYTQPPVTVTACVDDTARTVECIILPQAFATRPTATFTLNIGGEERIFACEVKTDAMESNTLYTMNVKIGRDKVEAGEITATPWGEPVDGGTLKTE